MKQINKLVRDNIPNLISADGRNPHTRTLNTDEFLVELDKKLLEEQQEFLEAHNEEELADVLEIIYAYCDYFGISFDDLERIRHEKAEKNGQFRQRLLLESISE